LKLSKEEGDKLKDIAAIAAGKIPTDIAEDIKEYDYLPVLLRTIANKQLSNEQLRQLTERINSER
jgi:hypothetical protein